jgi:hypothetical protein
MARNKKRQRNQRRSPATERPKEKVVAMRLLWVMLGALVLIGLAAAVFGVGRPSGGPDGVWSPEHGHYH